MKKFILTGALFVWILHGAVLENKQVKISFDRSNNFAVKSIVNKKTGRTVKCSPEAQDGLWTLHLYNGTRYIRFTAPAGFKPEVVSGKTPDGGKRFTVLWRDLKVNPEQTVTVQADITLAPGSDTADFNLKADLSGRNAPLWIFRYTYPEIHNIASLGDDYLIWGYHYGRLLRSPGTRLTHEIGNEWSSAFAAFYGSELHKDAAGEINDHKVYRINGYLRGSAVDETALVVMADDPDGHYKYIRFTTGKGARQGVFSLLPEHYPAYPAWPYEAYKKQHLTVQMPYRVKAGSVAGGMGASVNAFREMVKDYPFLSRGKIHDPAAGYSPKIKDNVFWGKFYFAANKVVRDIAEYHQYLRVPVNIFWYRYYANAFDDNNLDYYPTMGFFREGVRALKDLNIGVVPYVCYGIWDRDAESFDRKNIISATARNAGGKPIEWVFKYPHKTIVNYFWNPAAPLAHREYLNVSGKLFGQMGMAGQYCDVLASLGKLCYSPEFNSVNGGNYWRAGANKTVAALRKMALKTNPEAIITSECFNEYYIGNIDAFLMLDMTREEPVSFGGGNNIEVYPVVSLMYHDYTTFYGGDGNPAAEGNFTRWLLGTYFTQGTQMAYGAIKLPAPGTDKYGNDEFVRELAHAWYRSGGKFLNGGRHLESETLKTEKFLGNVPLSIVSPEGLSMQGRFPITSPAILGGAWLADNGAMAVNLTNITDREVTAKIFLRPGTANCRAGKVWQTWPLPVKSCGKLNSDGVYAAEIKFPPRSVMMFEVNSEKPQVRELLDIDSKNVYSDAKNSGAFPAVSGAKGKIYISDEVMTENKIAADGGNTVRLRNINDNSLRVNGSFACDWTTRSGLGGSRNKRDRSFHVLQVAPVNFSGAGTLYLQGSRQVVFGRIKTASGGSFSAAPGMGLLINGNDGVKFFADGRTDLAPGVYWFAVFGKYVPEKNESAADFAARLSGEGAKTAAELLNTSHLTEKMRRDGENAMHIGNGAAYVLTRGIQLVNNTSSDEVVFGLTAVLDYALTYSNVVIEDTDCRILDPELKKYYDLRPVSDLKNTVAVCQLEGANNMVRVMKTVYARCADGKKITLTDLSYLETVEPLLMTLNNPEKVSYGAPGNIRLELYIRNISNTDLPIRLKAILPDRTWSSKPVAMELKKLSSCRIALNITPPAGFIGKVRLPVQLTYAGFEAGKTHEYLNLTVKDLKFNAVDRSNRKFSGNTSVPRLRHGVKAVLIAGDDRNIEVDLRGATTGWAAIKNVTYSITSATPKKMPVASGVINLDASGHGKLKISVPAPGAYFVEFTAKWCNYDFKNRHYSWFASDDSPLNFSDAGHNMYIYVKPGVKEFFIGGMDGGATETVKMVLHSPDGREIWSHNGNMSRGEEYRITVPTGMDGKVWQLFVDSVDDFSLILGEGVSKLVSLSPEAVIND